jgi:hypothetical protein
MQSKLHRDVLRMAGTPRKPGDIRFLSGDANLTTARVVQCLEQLSELHFVVEEHGLWRLTEDGMAALRRIQEWEFAVDEVFVLAERSRPLVVGVVRQGVVHMGDWFLVNGDKLGNVLTIELVCGPGLREGQTTITVDTDVRPGDVLTRHEPTAPGSA